MTMEHLDPFGINYAKSCGVYLDIQNISNKKCLICQVVDLVEYYNFDIKFVIIGHHLKSYEIFCSISLLVQAMNRQ
jgi:hypothetical protein